MPNQGVTNLPSAVRIRSRMDVGGRPRTTK